MAISRGKDARGSSSKALAGLEKLEDRVVLTAAGYELPGELPVTLEPTAVVSQPPKPAAVVNAVPRIVNGEQTDQFPAVGVVNGQCTGTLISPTHVLTAAHCVEGVGNGQGTFEVNGQTYNTVRITSHPLYNPDNFDAGYDIAIMELDRPVSGVQPMQILRTVPQVGQMLTLVGYGEGGTSTGGFDPNDDGKQVGRTELEEVNATHIAWNFDSHNEANTAPGDSGGPAFVNVNGQYLVAGVTSGGTGVAQSLGDYSFDTRVDVLADWIDGVVTDTSPNPSPSPNPTPTPTPDPGDGGGSNDFSPEAEAQYELDVYDANKNGELSMPELVQEFRDYGDNIVEAQLNAQSLLQDYDANGNNQLSYDELVVSWGGQSTGDSNPNPTDPNPIDPTPDPSNDGGESFTPQSEAQYELDVYDTNGNGKLSQQELVAEFLDYGDSNAAAQQSARWLIEDYDANGDNQLDYAELVVSWGGSAGASDSDEQLHTDTVFGDDDWWYDPWVDDTPWWYF